MGEFFDLPTIIVIGLAIVILLRLRSVLGTRTGNERPPMERYRSSTEGPARDADDTVVQLRTRRSEESAEIDDERRARKLEAEIEQLAGKEEGVAQGLRAIAAADPAFMPKAFLEGAKSAYEMIVTAYATGDRRTLKNLLEKDVYEGFESAIAEREAAGQKTDFTFVGLPGIEFTDAELDKRTAQITLRFDAEVVSATYAADGQLVEGNADQIVNISDEWTFARSVRSRDPNWKLVATNQLG